MKKNKGFTLLELLAVIIILALITGLIIPSIIKVMKDSKDKLYNEQVNLIINSAKKYGVEHYDELDKSNPTYVTVNKLISTGFIENKEVLDPRTGSKMQGCVVISYNSSNKKYDYEYRNSCS